MFQRDHQRSAPRAGFTACVALASVLFMQFGFAAHADHDHHLDELGEYCEICVQIEQGTATDSGSSHSCPHALSAAVIKQGKDRLVVACPFRSPHLRGPPALT